MLPYMAYMDPMGIVIKALFIPMKKQKKTCWVSHKASDLQMPPAPSSMVPKVSRPAMYRSVAVKPKSGSVSADVDVL